MAMAVAFCCTGACMARYGVTPTLANGMSEAPVAVRLKLCGARARYLIGGAAMACLRGVKSKGMKEKWRRADSGVPRGVRDFYRAFSWWLHSRRGVGQYVALLYMWRRPGACEENREIVMARSIQAGGRPRRRHLGSA